MNLLVITLYGTSLSLIIPGLFIGILLFYLLGVRIRDYITSRDQTIKAEGIGALESALLGLLSLLLSFTFGISSSRYDSRRALIIQEANNIGTVILRSDMYPDSIRNEFRNDLKEYVELRIAYYDASDELTIDQLRSKAEKISGSIWQRTIIYSKKSPDFVRDNQMIPAINAMIDIVGSRDASRLAIVPASVIFLLISLTILGSFIIGYSKTGRGKDWIVLTLYALMTVMTIYTILDLDRPRRGFIRTSAPHEKIGELRSLFSQ